MPKETLRKGPYPGKPESMDDHEEPSRPPPYEIEEAFQAAFTQEIPSVPHTDDLEEEYARVRAKQEGREQPRAEQGTEQSGTGTATEQDQNGTGQDSGTAASVTETRSNVQPLGQVRAKLPPLTLAEKLRPLRPWMRQYVTALMNLGGNDTLACQRVRVALHSCLEYQQIVPEFAAAVREAKEWALNLVDASLYQSATVGDLEAVYRGPYLVGWKRVKSTKAAELLLEMGGKLGDRGSKSGSTHITVNAKNAVVAPQLAKADLPALVADTVNRLIQANRGRPLKVVAEKDATPS